MGAALAIEHLVHITPESPYAFLPLTPVTTMRTIFAWKKYQILTKAEEIFLKELSSVLEKTKSWEAEDKK